MACSTCRYTCPAAAAAAAAARPARARRQPFLFFPCAGATFYGLDGWSIHKGACGLGYQVCMLQGAAGGWLGRREGGKKPPPPVLLPGICLAHRRCPQPPTFHMHTSSSSSRPLSSLQYKNLGTGWDVAAIADASPEFQGSCG